MAPAQSAEDSHSCGMRAGHLDDESTFNFIPWLRALNKGQARVDGGLGDTAEWQPGGCNELMQ
jgi:hypothetical protein